MTAEFGPYVQMRTLAEKMAARYQMDPNLALEPYLSHYMDEVEVNIAADSFDHLGFMNKIRDPLKITAEVTSDPRRKEFLQSVVDAIQERVQRF